MQPHEDWRSRGNIPGVVPALIVIGIGLLFLLNNLNIFFIHDIWRYWPGILIAVGLVKMVDSPHSNGRLIGAGLLMLWSRLAPLPAGVPNIPAGAHEGALNEHAVFGGVERKVSTDDFRGGHISTMR